MSQHLYLDFFLIFKLWLRASIGYLVCLSVCLSVCLQNEILDEFASLCLQKKPSPTKSLRKLLLSVFKKLIQQKSATKLCWLVSGWANIFHFVGT